MESSSTHSISDAFQKVQAGDEGKPLERLVKEYFEELAKCADSRLPPQSRIVADGEDVANEVFASFCRAVKDGLYKNVENRNDLRKLLFAIMKNKVIDLIRWQKARKREGGIVRSEIGNTVESVEPTPADVAELNDLVHRLFEKLDEGKKEENALKTRKIAQMKLDGYEEEEIAAKAKCSVSSVRRCAAAIREIWRELAREAAAAEPTFGERSDGDSPLSSIESEPIPPAGRQPADGESPDAQRKRAPKPRKGPRELPDG